jgi:hypothetical protein
MHLLPDTRRTPRQISLGSLCRTPHTHPCACRHASPCTEQGCSHVLRQRSREGAPPLPPIPPATASHRLANPTLVLAHALRHCRPLRRARSGARVPNRSRAPHRASCQQPLPVPTASPARTSLARLRTGPSSKPSSAPPPGRCVSAILKPRRPPSPRPRSDAALPDAAGLLRRAPSSPSRGTRPARGPRPPVRSHHRPDTPSLGAFSLMRVPSTPRGFLAYSTALLYYILCL